MNSKLYLVLALTILCGKISAQSSFISVKDHQFIQNNKPYYYIGTNYWYGGLTPLLKDEKRGKERVKKELDFLKSKGVTNLRVVAGAEGSGMINGVIRVGPPLQPEKGVFNENVLNGLDFLLSEMGKRKMKAVLYLSNNWEWSGGFQQYLIWNNLVPEDQKTRKLTWDEQKDIVSKFYTCQPCKEGYNQQLKLILNRKNKYNGKKYTEEPAIMAWELANEPRPMRSTSDAAYSEWIKNTSGLIKSVDKNHLVTIGNEGEMGTENMQLFEDIHALKNIDYLTIHIWPKNWSWFADTAINRDLEKVKNKTQDYIQKHVIIAEKIKKPLVIEEFGLPRDLHSFDPKSTTTSRDAYFKSIFTVWDESRKTNGVIGGCSFWAFGGTARPIPGQVFWKKGDDLMGDPPMEEQGLNTIFDSDLSTWKLITSFTKKL